MQQAPASALWQSMYINDKKLLINLHLQMWKDYQTVLLLQFLTIQIVSWLAESQWLFQPHLTEFWENGETLCC